ncbi:unnamed protein product [Medioppia subpectinata]|uniref:Homeobox domain-containing protein n=1 Tax=Medioppia subpectinata TaxID=1979941 RepID=A0A7R9PUM9_9ACAR|nr:unnamed protein product [Medioppia subpectinata]CAG2101702.1 unnamed protein product [Medioppia subpectinata]
MVKLETENESYTYIQSSECVTTKRCRTRFNLWQIQRLEQVFHETHYPDAQQMHGLAQETSIPTPKMQIWFQNRRAKWRKNSRLKNFGGLASVRETAYVPAPHTDDTHQSLSLDTNLQNYSQNDIQIKSDENNAIDLRIRSLESECENLSSHSMFDSNVYKKCAGITRSSFGCDDRESLCLIFLINGLEANKTVDTIVDRSVALSSEIN